MNKPESISEEMLSAYLDDELTLSERERVTDELERDAELRIVLAELQQIRDDIRGLPQHILSADFAHRITQTAQQMQPGDREEDDNVSRRDNSLAASRQRIVLGTLATAATILIALWAVGPDRAVPVAKTPGTNATDDPGLLPFDSPESAELLAESINVETQPDSMAAEAMSAQAMSAEAGRSFGIRVEKEMIAAEEMVKNLADAPTETMNYALDAMQPQQAAAEDFALQAPASLAFEPGGAESAARGGITGGGFAGDATAGASAANEYHDPAAVSMDDSRGVPLYGQQLYGRSLAQEFKSTSPEYDAIYRLEVAENEWDNRLRSYRGRTQNAGLAKAESVTPDSTAWQEGEVTRMVVLEGTAAEIQNSLSSLHPNVPMESFFESVAFTSPQSQARQQPRVSGNTELQRIPVGKNPRLPRARYFERSKHFSDGLKQIAEGDVSTSSLAADASPSPETARPTTAGGAAAADASAAADAMSSVRPSASAQSLADAEAITSTPATGGRSEANAAAFIIPTTKAESDNGIAVDRRQQLLDRQRDFGNVSPATGTQNEVLARGLKASGQETRYRVLLVITQPANVPADEAANEAPVAPVSGSASPTPPAAPTKQP